MELIVWPVLVAPGLPTGRPVESKTHLALPVQAPLCVQTYPLALMLKFKRTL